MPENGTGRSNWARYMELSQVGLEMVSPVIIGVLIDQYLEWGPWLTIAGAFLGFGGGMVHLYQMLNRLDKDNGTNGQGQGES